MNFIIFFLLQNNFVSEKKLLLNENCANLNRMACAKIDIQDVKRD